MRKRLTRRQLVEHIRNIMPDNLSELEMSAFIEYEIAKQIVFDEDYLWGENVKGQIGKYIEAREQARVANKYYASVQNQTLQEDEPPIKRRLICMTMSELYVYVAKQFGLDVKYQKSNTYDHVETGNSEIIDTLNEETLDHVCPVQQLKDGRIITVDIQRDLHKLQTRSKTKGFGTKDNSDVDKLERDEIDGIFRKVYGLNDAEDFTNVYARELLDKLNKEQIEPLQKIKRIIEDPRIQQETKNLGVWGAKQFYHKILLDILGVSVLDTFFRNGTHAYISTCSIAKEQGPKKHTIFLYVQDYDAKICYIFSKKSRKMIPITGEELKQMQAKSMIIKPATNNFSDIGAFIDKQMSSFIAQEPSSATEMHETGNIEDLFTYEFEEEEK